MTAPPGAAAPAAPGLWRRLACFLYEGVLLFGVVMVTGLIYAGITQQRHALIGQHGLQFALFVVLGAYFVAFWSRGGQTLAMKTWHIRVVDREGAPLTPARALLRYLWSWLWFLPALLWAWVSGAHSGPAITVALLVGVCGYAALARLNPQRQYWHDLLSGTRLVDWTAPARRRG
jgi:uncharacterized RDD family membrane protein YckC